LSAPIVSVPEAIVLRPAHASADGLALAGAAEAGALLAAADGTTTEGAAVGACVAAPPVQAASSTIATVATLNKARRMTGSLMKG
jgi:hypothetical protein